jgi:hypothetical protein
MVNARAEILLLLALEAALLGYSSVETGGAASVPPTCYRVRFVVL